MTEWYYMHLCVYQYEHDVSYVYHHMSYNTYNFSEESYLTFYDIKIFKKAKEMCYPTPS